MTHREKAILDRVVTFAAFGGFAFMAIIGWMLAFDVASIATLIADTVKRDILTVLIVGGAVTKGAVVGAAIGMASLTLRAPRRQAVRA